jgi:WW domain-containing oxidoreductase
MLSQLHLALMLLPTLKATAETIGRPSRLVLMSSEMHSFSPSSTEFSSVKEINTDFGATELYARSKLAQILITRELARRLDKEKLGFSQTPSHRLVIVNATHPGGVKTSQQDQMPAAYGETAGKVITKMVRPLLTDPIRHGCRSELFAATSLKMFEERECMGSISCQIRKSVKLVKRVKMVPWP